MKNEVLIRITGEQTGDSYLAKSYKSYSTGIYFPNDKVKIKVNKKEHKK